MTFHVGQRVVCVDDANWRKKWIAKCPNRPIAGSVYTIREIRQKPNSLGFLLMEITNRPRKFRLGRLEPCFYAHRFRPVRDTDISIFTSMLSPAPTDKVSA